MAHASQSGSGLGAATSVTIGATILAVATLYVPQPLLHTLAERFDLAASGAALSVTLTMLPLSIAPIVYGLLLESVPAGRLAALALGIIAAGHLGVAFSTTWTAFLCFRFLQGLAVPAVLTSVMTLLSESATPQRIRRVMALYITATIFGGFFGRFSSGVLAWAWGWQAPFFMLALFSALACLFLAVPGVKGRASFERPDFSRVVQALKQPELLRVYLMIFCCFFTFSATLNFLPFRLNELEQGVSELRAGSMYLGYLVGIAAALLSTRMAERFGEAVTLRVGIVIFASSVAACALPSGNALLLTLFPFCIGFFLVQSLGPGVVNTRVEGKRGVVNGLYIAFYYGGGTLGSIAPGFIYHSFGWGPFIVVLVGVLLVALILTRGLGHHAAK